MEKGISIDIDDLSPENIIKTSDFRFREMQGVVKEITEEPGIFGRFSPAQQKVLKFHYLERKTDENIVEEMKLDTQEDVWNIHDSAIKDLSMLAACSGAESLTEEGLVKKLVKYHENFLKYVETFRKRGGNENVGKIMETVPSVIMKPPYISTRDREILKEKNFTKKEVRSILRGFCPKIG